MKRFHFKALDGGRKVVEGDIDALEAAELERHFRQENLIPLRIEEREVSSPEPVEARPGHQGIRRFFLRRLADVALIAFTRQFAAAYGAGVSIPVTLDMLSTQTGNEEFRKAIAAIAARIQQGMRLTDAFAEFPEYFDSTYISILKSGEASGNLDKVLDYAAGLLEKKLMHRERIRSTLLYPKIVLGILVITFTVIMLFVMPQFAKFYDRLGAQLPLPTRIMIALSNFAVANWKLAIPLAVGGWFALGYVKRKVELMRSFHERWLWVPVLGPTSMKIELAFFCNTFALLLRSGITVVESTRISLAGIRNSFLREELGHIVKTIEQGGTLSGALGKVRVLPPIMASMVRIGEEAGTLEALLERVAVMYENESELVLKRLPTILEPVVLSVLFVMVLGLALAVYLPMWKMASILK